MRLEDLLDWRIFAVLFFQTTLVTVKHIKKNLLCNLEGLRISLKKNLFCNLEGIRISYNSLYFMSCLEALEEGLSKLVKTCKKCVLYHRLNVSNWLWQNLFPIKFEYCHAEKKNKISLDFFLPCFTVLLKASLSIYITYSDLLILMLDGIWIRFVQVGPSNEVLPTTHIYAALIILVLGVMLGKFFLWTLVTTTSTPQTIF